MKKATFVLEAVVLLVICSALASAGIESAWTHGNIVPEVKGCIEYDDSEYIIAEADVAGENLAPDSLKISNMFDFTSCEESGMGYHCVYDPQLQDPGALDPAAVAAASPLEIKLFEKDASGNLVVADTKYAPVAVDTKGPVITNFHLFKKSGENIENKIIGPGTDIEISYEVIEDCSGFKESFFKVQHEEKGKETREEKNILSQQIKHSVNVADIKPGSGWTNEPVDICMGASDWFGQSSEEDKYCLKLTVDEQAPVIKNLMVNRGGALLTNGQGTVETVAEIKDISNLQGVSANFKNLNKQDIFVDADSCVKSEDYHVCTWSAVGVDLENAGNINIEVKAADEFGNSAQASFEIAIAVDSDAPVIAGFTTNYKGEGFDYVKGKDNQFTAAIEDSSGIAKGDIQIDLGTLLGAGNVKSADECVKNENEYVCKWKVSAPVSGNQGDERIVYLSAKDILGNAAEAVSLKVKIDKLNPEPVNQVALEGEILTEDSKIRIEPSYSPLEGSIVGSSTLKITALIKDDTKVYAFADVTNIVQDSAPYSDGVEWVECASDEETDEGILWLCVIGTEPTKLIDGRHAISIYLKDSAGNEIRLNENLNFKTTGIDLVPRIEVFSNEYKLQEEGDIIGTSSLDIKAYVSSVVNPLPEIQARLTVPSSLGISNGRETTVEGDCSRTETINDILNVVCEWGTVDWEKDGNPSGKVPRENGEHTLLFDFKYKVISGNELEGFQHKIRVLEPKPMEIKDIQTSQDLSSIFGAGVPPHFKEKIVAEYPVVVSVKLNHPGYSESLEQSASLIKEESYADLSELLEPVDGNDWKQTAADSCSFNAGSETAPAYWECVWSTSISNAPAKNISKTVEIRFDLKDSQLNEVQGSHTFKVIRKRDVTDESYWTIKELSLFPQIVDRQTAAILSQKVEARIELEPKGNYEVLRINQECSGDTSYVDGDINIRSEYTSSPWIYFSLKKQGITADKITFNCTLKIMFKEEDYIYTAPTELNVPIEVPFYGFELGEFSENIKEKIQGAMDNSLVSQDFIGSASKILGQFVKICRIVYALTDLNNALSKIEMASAPLQGNPITAPIPRTINRVTSATDVSSKGIVNTLYKFCEYVMCDKTLWQDKIINHKMFLGEYGYLDEKDTATRREYSKYSWFEEYGISQATFWPANPSDSLVLSAATGCIPGIIFNLQKIRNIECTYALCLYDTSRQGLSIVPCEKEKGFAYCKYVYGQIFELVPFKSFFEWASLGLSQVFHDPLSTFIGIKSWNCRHITENAAHARCVMGDFGKIVDLLGKLERAKTSIGTEPPGEDVCDQAESIIAGINQPSQSSKAEEEPPVLEGTG